MSDFIATNVLHNKNVYRQAKYKEVEVKDEEAAAAAAVQAEYEKSSGVNGNGNVAAANDLSAPLREDGTYASDMPSGGRKESEGVLHVSPVGRHPRYSSSPEDDAEAPWAVAHFPKR